MSRSQSEKKQGGAGQSREGAAAEGAACEGAACEGAACEGAACEGASASSGGNDPYIRDKQELAAFCERVKQAGVVAVDAEFIRDRTYYPQLALLQMAVGEEARLIDPLADLDLAPIDALILDPDVRKVLHAATQDLEIFYHRTGKLPANVFDTQIAAAMLGMGAQISYGGLIEKTTGVVLKKGKACLQLVFLMVV